MKSLRADALLLLMTALWGVTFVVVADAQKQSDAFSFLACRFLVAGVACTLVARKHLIRKDIWLYGSLLGIPMYLGFVFQTLGLRYTTPSRSAFLTGLAVVVVPFLSWWLMKRVPRLSALLGVGMASWGLYLLTGGVTQGAVDTAWGDFLSGLCAVAFAFHIALNEKWAPHFPVMGLVTVQMWVLTLLSCAAFLIAPPQVAWSASWLSAVLFCGIFASAIAFSASTWAQARVPAVRAALIYALEPVFASVYSVGMGREMLGKRELQGGGLIVMGVLTAELGAWAWDKWRRASQAAASK